MTKLSLISLIMLTECGLIIQEKEKEEENEDDFVCSTSHFRKKQFAISQGKPTALFPAIGELICGNNGCSATLIGEETLITASHCIPEAASCVFEPSVGDKIYTMREVIRYGEWVDLALIKLNAAVPIKPRALTDVVPVIGDDIIYVGYGKIEGSIGGGIKRYGCSTIQAWSVAILFTSIGGSEACPGDSGGPVMNSNGNLIGVISIRAAKCGVGTGSTAIYSFIDWILDEAQDETIVVE